MAARGARVGEADIEGYRFTAKPASRWRRITGDFLPYWQGSSPRFILTVRRIEDIPATLPTTQPQIYWFVRFATGDTTGGMVDIPDLATNESRDFVVGGRFLGFTGDTLLVLPEHLNQNAPNQNAPSTYHTLHAFHTTPKTWIFLTVVVALLAGIFATLGQWLIRLLN